MKNSRTSSRDGRKQAHEKNNKEGQALVNNWTNYADGRVLSGSEAFKYGFVDELGDFDKAVERAKKIARIPNANLIEYRERYDISDFSRMFGQSEFRARHQARSGRGDAEIAGRAALFSLAHLCELK